MNGIRTEKLIDIIAAAIIIACVAIELFISGYVK